MTSVYSRKQNYLIVCKNDVCMFALLCEFASFIIFKD